MVAARLPEVLDHRARVEAPVSLHATASLLRGLNREQRQAVTHASGAALVLAGPGTGKTEVVTRRVAWLIASKRARPRQILALTFTDNAAREMQARVDVLVPYGQADAAIHTFHAFGDRLVREHAFELGLSADCRLLPRSELVVLLREHLFELGLDRYRPLGDPARFLGALVDLFGRAKDEDVDPSRLAEHARELAASAGAAGDEAERARLLDLASARAELAIAYERYVKLLAARGVLDHADQVALAVRLLRRRPAALHDLGARFTHVLVDELQDTNRSQLELIRLLGTVNGNVMAVGDPDQSIYGFRGAMSGNVERFRRSFESIRTIELRRNYRSTASVVAAAGRVRSHAAGRSDDRGIRAHQVAHRRGRAAPVRVLSYPTPEDEADGVAAAIAERVAQGARPSDFCVLVRSNTEIDGFLRSLRVRGMPAHSAARGSLFDSADVRALVAFLRVTADPTDSMELFALAAAWPYELGGDLLASLLGASRRRNRSLWEALRESVEVDDTRLDRQSAERVARLVDHVRHAVDMSAERPSGEVLYDYLRRSGLLARLARATDEDSQAALDVARFCELVRERARLLVHDRVPFLAEHLQELDRARDAEPEAAAADAVSVLTVHRAKGLEFKTVFVCSLVDGRFPVRARPATLCLPPELAGGPGNDDDALAEERRLFYVALTRARDELVLTTHESGPRGRGRRRPSIFIAEAIDAPPATQVESARAAPDIDLGQVLVEPADVAPPRSAGGPLKLSYSQIDEYLTCPERYRLRYHLGIPTPPHHALSYGTAVHQTIAAFHAAQMQGTVLSVDDLLTQFGRNWRPEGFLSREHEEARFAAGREALLGFHAHELASGVVPAQVERPFSFRLDPDEIRGRIDRVDETPSGTVITDYKSSDVRDQKRADKKAAESLQLSVYALAHEAVTGQLPAAVALHFVDSGMVGRAAPNPARMDKARATIAAAADGIRSQAFDPKPSSITCGYCPFRSVCRASAA